jgi:hypothetical protein
MGEAAAGDRPKDDLPTENQAFHQTFIHGLAARGMVSLRRITMALLI